MSEEKEREREREREYRRVGVGVSMCVCVCVCVKPIDVKYVNKQHATWVGGIHMYIVCT